jgi:hypothetical protein
MKRSNFSLLSLLLILAWGCLPVRGFVNNGLVSVALPPQIDDISFVNNGEFDLNYFNNTSDWSGLETVFDTQNTLYYTNRGTMNAFSFWGEHGVGLGAELANTGFNLQYVNGDTGEKLPAAVITNAQTGSIFGEPFIYLSATNLSNRGTLGIPFYGVMRLSGQNLDLSNGRLDLGNAQSGLFDGSVTGTNFVPASGISDIHWGTNTVTLNLTNFFQYLPSGVTVTTPPYPVSRGAALMRLLSPLAFVNTNSFGDDPKAPTTQVVEAVFVVNNNKNVGVDVTFQPSTEGGNPFNTILTKFSGTETNSITHQAVQRQIILSDSFASATNLLVASETNLFLLTNSLTLRSFRPANFNIFRAGPNGSPANSTLTSDTFSTFYSVEFTNGMAYTNTFVNPFYSAYLANVNSSLSAAVSLPGFDYTNYPGRLQIDAENLNLENVRVGGSGVALVKANHLISSKNAQIDVPIIFYDLGAPTTGNLMLQNLGGGSITRFASGTIQAWSALWTNGFDVTTMTVADDGTTNTATTNYTTMFHVLLVTSQLSTDGGNTGLAGLTASATNTTVVDKLTVSDNFYLASDSLTVNGLLQLGNSSTEGFFRATNVPSLRFLTNTGNITVYGSPNYGADRDTPYETFINSGTNAAYSMAIGTKLLHNSGRIESVYGPITIAANDAVMDGGNNRIDVFSDLTFTATTLKLKGATIDSTAGALTFAVSDSFSDAGGGSGNVFSSPYGIYLPVKPTTSSLLGSSFVLNVPEEGFAELQWPASDLGVSRDGFSNNLAIGELTLTTDTGGFITISGANGGKAMYVDHLELSSLIAENLEGSISMADDFYIYFADSNVPVEQLDGALNGHLRWVRNFAGPISGVNVALADGTTILVNRNLFNSSTIDSDGDGIANAADTTPFGGSTLTFKVVASGTSVQISWLGAALTQYRVESTASLINPDWQLVQTLGNDTLEAKQLQVSDPIPAGSPLRYYRVTYVP